VPVVHSLDTSGVRRRSLQRHFPQPSGHLSPKTACRPWARPGIPNALGSVSMPYSVRRAGPATSRWCSQPEPLLGLGRRSCHRQGASCDFVAILLNVQSISLIGDRLGLAMIDSPPGRAHTLEHWVMAVDPLCTACVHSWTLHRIPVPIRLHHGVSQFLPPASCSSRAQSYRSPSKPTPSRLSPPSGSYVWATIATL